MMEFVGAYLKMEDSQSNQRIISFCWVGLGYFFYVEESLKPNY